MAKGKPLPHGYAVAYGLVCELYLSCVVCGFPATKMRQTANFIKEYYGTISYKCDNYDTLLNYMSHDKKNTMGHINFSLLSDIGKLELNQIIDKDLIKEALDFYRDALG